MTPAKESNLLVEGTKSYPKALGALNEFSRLVISHIRNAVLEEIGSLSAAMDIEITDGDLADYVRPNKLSSFDSKNVYLGVSVDRYTEAGWLLYFVLDWSKAEVRVSVSIWIKDGDVANAVFAALNAPPSKEVALDSGHEVAISRAILPENAEELPATVRELVGEFSKRWSKAGGLQKFLKPKAKSSAE